MIALLLGQDTVLPPALGISLYWKWGLIDTGGADKLQIVIYRVVKHAVDESMRRDAALHAMSVLYPKYYSFLGQTLANRNLSSNKLFLLIQALLRDIANQATR